MIVWKVATDSTGKVAIPTVAVEQGENNFGDPSLVPKLELGVGNDGPKWGPEICTNENFPSLTNCVKTTPVASEGPSLRTIVMKLTGNPQSVVWHTPGAAVVNTERSADGSATRRLTVFDTLGVASTCRKRFDIVDPIGAS